MAYWLGCWICNLEVPGSNTPLNGFVFNVLDSTLSHFVNSQLVSLLQVSIFMFVCLI